METLSIADCRPFIEHFEKRITETGLMHLLKEYGQSGTSPVGRAVESWYLALEQGYSYQKALNMMTPRFDPLLEELVSLAGVHSILDYVLHNLVQIYRDADSDSALSADIRDQVERLRRMPLGDEICEDCFQHSMYRLIKHAEIENAYQVICEQEGEDYFHCRYIGALVMICRKSCHSKVYKTIRDKLSSSAQSQLRLSVHDRQWNVSVVDAGQFKLVSGQTELLMTFR